MSPAASPSFASSPPIPSATTTSRARQEWLIIAWPEGEDAPSDYWLSNLPEETSLERLARLARLRWQIELDDRQLKGELGLDHDEGRSYLGLHHHTALVTCAHAFLTLERLDPKVLRPA
jgi:SRSO17 transposase